MCASRLSPLASRLSTAFFTTHTLRECTTTTTTTTTTIPTRHHPETPRAGASHRHARQTTRATAHTPVVRSVGPRTRATKPYPKSRAYYRVRVRAHTRTHVRTHATHAHAIGSTRPSLWNVRYVAISISISISMSMSIARIDDRASSSSMMGARRRGLRDARAVCVIHTYACDDDYPSIHVYTRGLSYRVRDFTPIARARATPSTNHRRRRHGHDWSLVTSSGSPRPSRDW